MNAGKYKHRIKITAEKVKENASGYKQMEKEEIARPYAEVKTTAGMNIIASNSDFEEATTRFTIRYNKAVADAYEYATRDIYCYYGKKKYHVEYLNVINEERKEIEMQAKVVRK